MRYEKEKKSTWFHCFNMYKFYQIIKNIKKLKIYD